MVALFVTNDGRCFISYQESAASTLVPRSLKLVPRKAYSVTIIRGVGFRSSVIQQVWLSSSALTSAIQLVFTSFDVYGYSIGIRTCCFFNS